MEVDFIYFLICAVVIIVSALKAERIIRTLRYWIAKPGHRYHSPWKGDKTRALLVKKEDWKITFRVDDGEGNLSEEDTVGYMDFFEYW